MPGCPLTSQGIERIVLAPYFLFFTKTTLRAIASDQSHFISPLKNLLHRNLELKENRINAFREAQNIWRETSLLRYLFIYLFISDIYAGWPR